MKTSIGLCGATGKTPELQIGQVKTVEHTQKASVEITGTRENPILNFNIPKGKDGAKLIVREYFNGDIQILNNLNELPQNTNSDSYGKTVMSVNGIKQLLEKISDVLTKANANTNAIGSLTSTVQGNKSDIELKLNNFKSDTDTKFQSINQTISELEQTIETKLNEELTKQVKALQDENKKLNYMIFENSLKENFEGSTSSISDTSNGVALIETIKGQTIVTDAPTETNPNVKTIESVGDKENNKISILSNNKNLFNMQMFGDVVKPFITNINSVHWINNEVKAWQSLITWNNYTKLKPNTLYGLKCDLVINANKGRGGFYIRGVNNEVINCSESGATCWFVTPSDGLVSLGLRGTWADDIAIDIEFNNITLVEFNTIPETKEEKQSLANTIVLEKPKEDKKEILIPLDGGLKSLPNGVADTIEQREDGIYLVQRIGKYIFTGNENLVNSFSSPNNFLQFYDVPNIKKSNSELICDTLIVRKDVDGDKISRLTTNDGLMTCGNEREVRIRIKGLEGDVDGVKNWFRQNKTTIYYELNSPIETKLDINNLNLKTFKDLTYVTSENYIKPVLKGQATKDITTVIKNLQSKGAN